ncbi:hypothetical protein DN069_08280 [Streptacidiphilus pinicola]|uniref:SPFH domain-containing protein n=1 Tax=Streptacidiphilus pinicola TaxID=2219663 RepID=A0A2X0IRA7_9ACTN|nr:hypothetical protein [Streptacidiphilus pinicola]RAG86103.1 hypothetical protein DN069_08280 [Streptacidiphilus pinicola]
MSQQGWAPRGAAPNAGFVLPAHLPGPFVSEFSPQGSYQHRGAQVASVIFYKNGGYTIATVRGKQNVNKPLFGAPTSVCLIARGQHQVSFQLDLPSLGDRATFRAEADVNWEVQDFHLAAEKRVVDVARMLAPSLQARLRAITRRHNLDSAQIADEAIQQELAGGHWADFGAELGLRTEVFVRIDLGQAAAQYQAQLVAVEKGSHVQQAIDAAGVARVEANMDAARSLIAAGEAGQYAHMLASDPSRAAEILGALQSQAREQRQGALDYLSKLISEGVVQRHQIEDQVQLLIDYSRSVAGNAFPNGLPNAAPTALPAPPVPLLPPTPPPVVIPQDAPADWTLRPAEEHEEDQSPAPDGRG